MSLLRFREEVRELLARPGIRRMIAVLMAAALAYLAAGQLDRARQEPLPPEETPAGSSVGALGRLRLVQRGTRAPGST
jgi:hypothetical protein